MAASEDHLSLGQRETLASSGLTDCAGDVLESEPGTAAPGEEIQPGGPGSILQSSSGRQAGAIEPLVLEHRLQPGTQRRRRQSIPTPVILGIEQITMLADVLPSEDDPGCLNACINPIAGAVGEVTSGVGSEQEIRERAKAHPGHAQHRLVRMGSDILPSPFEA